MNPRILIVGTIPYNTKDSSRAFDAYFHYWERQNLAQFFSDPKTPVKGHCDTLYQVTDYRLLQSWMHRGVTVGQKYYYDNLPDDTESEHIVDESKVAERKYRFGARHTPLTRILRGLLWSKRKWCTEDFNNWLDEFKPECVFLSFSDDYFIPQVAFYVAKKYNIPIVSSIGDDYYFNVKFSINPFYWIYKLSYRKLIRKVLSIKGSANYISDKIRDKYNKEFFLDGETVYLSSTVKRKSFNFVNESVPIITYFGNIKMGRNETLNLIGEALGKINPTYKLEIYSGEKDPYYYNVLKKNPNIYFGGTIPYNEVKRKMEKSDITIIVEGFKNKDVNLSRYSLSTKAADALASGTTILAVGSKEAGIIEYMKDTNAAFVCTNQLEIEHVIREIFDNPNLQKEYYHQQMVVTREHHTLEASCKIFHNIVLKAIKNNNLC